MILSNFFVQTLKHLLEELRLNPAELLPPLAYLGVVLVAVSHGVVLVAVSLDMRFIGPSR